jgi:hypothetical protein
MAELLDAYENFVQQRLVSKNRDRGNPYSFPSPTLPSIRVRTKAVRENQLF